MEAFLMLIAEKVEALNRVGSMFEVDGKDWWDVVDLKLFGSVCKQWKAVADKAIRDRAADRVHGSWIVPFGEVDMATQVENASKRIDRNMRCTAADYSIALARGDYRLLDFLAERVPPPSNAMLMFPQENYDDYHYPIDAGYFAGRSPDPAGAFEWLEGHGVKPSVDEALRGSCQTDNEEGARYFRDRGGELEWDEVKESAYHPSELNSTMFEYLPRGDDFYDKLIDMMILEWTVLKAFIECVPIRKWPRFKRSEFLELLDQRQRSRIIRWKFDTYTVGEIEKTWRDFIGSQT